MVQHTIFDLIGLLSVLIGITASWIFILINYKNLRKLEPGKFSNKRSLGTDFTIGIGSGLTVFVLGWFANNMNLPKIDSSSIINLLYSLFTGILSLLFQVSIVLALLSWIIVYTFKDLK